MRERESSIHYLEHEEWLCSMSMCVTCVCVCVVREREREREFLLVNFSYLCALEQFSCFQNFNTSMWTINCFVSGYFQA